MLKCSSFLIQYKKSRNVLEYKCQGSQPINKSVLLSVSKFRHNTAIRFPFIQDKRLSVGASSAEEGICCNISLSSWGWNNPPQADATGLQVSHSPKPPAWSLPKCYLENLACSFLHRRDSSPDCAHLRWQDSTTHRARVMSNTTFPMHFLCINDTNTCGYKDWVRNSSKPLSHEMDFP